MANKMRRIPLDRIKRSRATALSTSSAPPLIAWQEQVIGAAQERVRAYYLAHFERQKRREPTFFGSTRFHPQLGVTSGRPFAQAFLSEALNAFAIEALESDDAAAREIAKQIASILEALLWASWASDPAARSATLELLKVPHRWANGQKGGGVLGSLERWGSEQRRSQDPEQRLPLMPTARAFVSRPVVANELVNEASRLQGQRIDDQPLKRSAIIRELLIAIARCIPELAESATDSAALSKVRALEAAEAGNAKWQALAEPEKPEHPVREALRIARMSEAKVKTFFAHRKPALRQQ